ncbi:MAG: S41 family peptidase [Planctomycetota bacterium]|nr:MAG: S41 family peptidase [Planctomycetota bacterium]
MFGFLLRIVETGSIRADSLESPLAKFMLLVSLLIAFLQDPAAGDLDQLLTQAQSASPAQALVLAEDFEAPADEQWLKGAAGRLPELEGVSSLCLARVLALTGAPAGGVYLVDLLDPERPSLASAALATLRLETFGLDEGTQKALGDWLAGHAVEDHPELYTEAALVLFEIGDGARRRAARRLLAAAGRVEEEKVRSLALLTLARAGDLDNDDVLDELERLAAGFGPHAALAQSLLQNLEQRERYRNKLAYLESRYETESAVKGRAQNEGDLRLLWEVLRHIETLHMEGEQFSREELVAAAADGLLRRLDPHSSYLSGKEYGEFMFDIRPEYGGIGAYVDTRDEVFTIIRPIYSGPAYEKGLLSGDKILSVDGWSTLNQPNDEIIKRLKGKPGTFVNIEVHRRGWSESRKFDIERRLIEIPTLRSERFPGGVLYLELLSFAEDVGVAIEEQVAAAKAEGWLSGVVLDLRNNSGGLLTQAVAVCDVFLDSRQLIVSTRTRAGEIEKHFTREKAAVSDGIPLTVLVNEYSASASEIVAGALSAHGRATLIGERTHGKGSVQRLLPLRSLPDELFDDANRNYYWDEWEEFVDSNRNQKYDYGPRIKLTLAYYFLPDGSTIHTLRDHEGRVVEQGGVEPDVAVAFPEFDLRDLKELDRLIGESAFREYALNLYEENPEVAVDLAEFDGKDPLRYPGWDAYYEGLETDLKADVVRQWVRLNLRQVVSDARGKVFAGNRAMGDFVEDPQLQRAIQQVFQDAGKDIQQVPEYTAVVAAGAANGAETPSQEG